MKPTRLAAAVVAFNLLLSAGSAFAQQYYRPWPAQYADRDAEESMERRGFQDGTVGAEHDFRNHRRPDVNNRDEYRDPRFIPVWGRNEYREGFRHGYYRTVRQIYGEYPR